MRLLSDSITHLLISAQKLEGRMRSAGVPLFLARLPLFCLCWYYCKILDEKIGRIRRISGKIGKWLATVRTIVAERAAKLELIDLDKGMYRDLESTKRTLWDLRAVCLDVQRLFDSLGYVSAGLRQRQKEFLRVLVEAYDTATTLQQVMATHDQIMLTVLRQQADQQAKEQVRLAGFGGRQAGDGAGALPSN